MLTLRHLFKLALRQIEGFVRSLFKLLKISLIVPEFTRLSRRMKGTLAQLRFPSLTEKTYLVLDSSGLKVYGEKEWLQTKHGFSYQRKLWRKIHIGIDDKGIIHASQMTTHSTSDRACVRCFASQRRKTYIRPRKPFTHKGLRSNINFELKI